MKRCCATTLASLHGTAWFCDTAQAELGFRVPTCPVASAPQQTRSPGGVELRVITQVWFAPAPIESTRINARPLPHGRESCTVGPTRHRAATVGGPSCRKVAFP